MKASVFVREEEKTDINISPLIDMVFILLIFFIVTTVFVEESGLGMMTPEVTPPIIEKKSEPFILKMTEGGAVFYDGREIGFDGVAAAIRSARAMDELESVTLEIHPKAKVAAATELLDICEGQEVEKITMKAASVE